MVRLESSRYPFCFTGGPKDPNGTRSILAYVPFNQNLNRFKLVVNGLTSDEAEVAWGEATYTFSRAQLAAGINLVVEFPDNPFAGPFNAVMEAVQAKQNFETPMIKDLITRFRTYDRMFQDDAEVKSALDILQTKLFARDNELYAQAKATVKPVTHQIIITAKE